MAKSTAAAPAAKAAQEESDAETVDDVITLPPEVEGKQLNSVLDAKDIFKVTKPRSKG